MLPPVVTKAFGGFVCFILLWTPWCIHIFYVFQLFAWQSTWFLIVPSLANGRPFMILSLSFWWDPILLSLFPCFLALRSVRCLRPSCPFPVSDIETVILSKDSGFLSWEWYLETTVCLVGDGGADCSGVWHFFYFFVVDTTRKIPVLEKGKDSLYCQFWFKFKII